MAKTGECQTSKFSSKCVRCRRFYSVRVRLFTVPMDAGGVIGQTSPKLSTEDIPSMHLSRLLIATFLLAFVCVPSLHAQSAGSPYSVTVPVADTSDAQRDQAFATALGQVLTRVAGGQDLRSNAGYGDALSQASSIVQKFQYQRAATGLVLGVDFAPSSVRRLVSKLGVPSAGIKPPVLLLVQGTDGQLLDQDALSSLVSAVAARGTEVVYPDFRRPPDTVALETADPAALSAVNQKYHTGLVLIGKMHDGSADWTLVSGGQAQHWNTRGATEDALIASAGNDVVDRLGKQLNVIATTPSNGKLWVSGLGSAMDYANLLATLGADPSVTKVTTLAAQNDGVLLYVEASMPIDGLAANLAAGGRMLLQGESHAGADANLRWLH